MHKTLMIFLAAILLILTACGQKVENDASPGYTQISQDEARKMMARDDGHIVLDVRRPDEYQAGHIPGAILIPNESIGTERPNELPDPDQIILIYCRSGNRSKQAAKKLADLGYTNIYEFGGITDWKGETVSGTEPNQAILSTQEQPVLVLEANGHVFRADPEDNGSADALLEKLSSGAIELELHDYGNFEKVGPLPWELPRNDQPITTSPGDIILYQGDQITVYYDTNSWTFTRLARIRDVTGEELLSALGEGNVTVKFSLG